jgi:hypothetical protein
METEQSLGVAGYPCALRIVSQPSCRVGMETDPTLGVAGIDKLHGSEDVGLMLKKSLTQVRRERQKSARNTGNLELQNLKKSISLLSDRLDSIEDSVGVCKPPGLERNDGYDVDLLVRVKTLERVFLFVDWQLLEANARVLQENQKEVSCDFFDIGGADAVIDHLEDFDVLASFESRQLQDKYDNDFRYLPQQYWGILYLPFNAVPSSNQELVVSVAVDSSLSQAGGYCDADGQKLEQYVRMPVTGLTVKEP